MTTSSIDFCRVQQRRAMEEYKRTKDRLTELWWADWFAEEFLMEMEQVEARKKEDR